MSTIFLLVLFASYNVLKGHVKQCDQEKKDIVLILDSSNSISDKDFDYAKYAIFKAIRSLKVSKDHSRVAFIQFGSDAVLKFNLDTFNNMKSMAIEIKKSKHTHGLTAIGKALELTIDKVLPKMRSDVQRVIIVFTDGMNNVYPTPQIYADNLKAKNVRIICVGIGSNINKAELTRIASDHSILLMKSFHELVRDINRISDHLCIKPDPIPLKPCTVLQQDLVFLIDSSDSLSIDDFSKSKEFVKSFIKHVKLGASATRVAMISFSESIRIDFNLDEHSTEHDYIRAIDKSKKFGTATAIGGALNGALEKIWPKRRSSVPFNVILVTDGRNNVFPKPNIPATELKNKGANIVSVAVGKDIDFDELRTVSSNNRIITVLNYSQLLKGVRSVEKMVTCG